jgi:hypothetical protein
LKLRLHRSRINPISRSSGSKLRYGTRGGSGRASGSTGLETIYQGSGNAADCFPDERPGCTSHSAKKKTLLNGRWVAARSYFCIAAAKTCPGQPGYNTADGKRASTSPEYLWGCHD